MFRTKDEEQKRERVYIPMPHSIIILHHKVTIDRVPTDNIVSLDALSDLPPWNVYDNDMAGPFRIMLPRKLATHLDVFHDFPHKVHHPHPL